MINLWIGLSQVTVIHLIIWLFFSYQQFLCDFLPKFVKNHLPVVLKNQISRKMILIKKSFKR